MQSLLKEHVAEALAGVLVLIIAAWFLAFAWGRTGGSTADTYSVSARFPNATGISTGSDVRVSGIKVGTVVGQQLDPKSYQVVMQLGIRSDVKLPLDSSAAITSDGLLGGAHISLIPGGDPEMLRAGDEITDTQGAMDLMGLVGSFINRGGGDQKANGGGEAAPAGTK